MNFNDMKKIIDEKIENAIAKNNKLYTDGEKKLHKYDLSLMKKIKLIQVYIQPEDYEEAFERMFALRKSVKNVQLYEIEHELYIDTYDDYASVTYEAFELFPIESIEVMDTFHPHLYARVFKKFIADEIQDGKVIFGFTLDCKLLQLFKDEVIDFETLKNISLSNCRL